jgi:hypothetical protein
MNLKDYYSARITIVGGKDGSGKTLFCFHHPLSKKGFYLDLENRYKDILKTHPLITKEQYSNCQELDKNYDVDNIKTFKKIFATVTKLINNPDIELIVIDGISDLRRYAADKYCVENKAEAVYGPGPWGVVNNEVKKVLYRLFNYARVKEKMVVCTAWITDEYDENNKKTGKTSFDVKEFISSRADETIALKRTGTRFFIRSGKSPLGPTNWEDITWDEEEEEKPIVEKGKK